jgi:hypothetical protein
MRSGLSGTQAQEEGRCQEGGGDNADADQESGKEESSQKNGPGSCTGSDLPLRYTARKAKKTARGSIAPIQGTGRGRRSN